MCITGVTFWFAYPRLSTTNKYESGLNEVLETNSNLGESDFLSTLFHKSSIDKQNDVRINLQAEIASVIQDIRGIDSATVVVSGIGGLSEQSVTACVSVTPLDIKLPTDTVDAIRNIAAGAVVGLQPDNVMVVNNATGSICATSKEDTEAEKAAILKEKIQNAIGLTVASVSVHKPQISQVQIPMRYLDQQRIRVSVPTSWVAKRGKQVGSTSRALEDIKQIVKGVAPNAIVSLQVVKDKSVVSSLISTEESYSKQAVLVLALLVLLTIGIIVNRRQGLDEVQICVTYREPKEEAERILQMDYINAKQTIDSLDETRKIKVLHEIVSAEVLDSEIPLVHVSTSQKVEPAKSN